MGCNVLRISTKANQHPTGPYAYSRIIEVLAKPNSNGKITIYFYRIDDYAPQNQYQYEFDFGGWDDGSLYQRWEAFVSLMEPIIQSMCLNFFLPIAYIEQHWTSDMFIAAWENMGESLNQMSEKCSNQMSKELGKIFCGPHKTKILIRFLDSFHSDTELENKKPSKTVEVACLRCLRRIIRQFIRPHTASYDWNQSDSVLENVREYLSVSKSLFLTVKY
jgi:hypothetical protein